MASDSTKTKETSAITPRQKFERYTNSFWGAIHLPDGQRIITCSSDGTLKMWNLETRKQLGKDWRDGDSWIWTIALSPDWKKLISGSSDGPVRLWDTDTGEVITNTKLVASVWWRREHFVAYSTAASPIPMIRYCPPSRPGSKPYSETAQTK